MTELISRRLLGHGPVLIGILLVGSVLGLLIAGDFGQDIDEPFNASYGRHALAAYSSFPGPDQFPNLLKSTGSFFLMVWVWLAGLFSKLRQDWMLIDGGNLTVFLTFLMGAFGVYYLSRKFVREQAALFAAILFATQPLLFGHGFINQKDTPFMVFFTLGMAFGLSMVDNYSNTVASGRGALKLKEDDKIAVTIMSPIRTVTRAAQVSLLFILLMLVIDVLILDILILPLAKAQISAAYVGDASPPVNFLFRLFANTADQTSANQYIVVFETLYARYKLLLAVPFAAGALVIYFRLWPRHWLALQRNWILRYLVPASILLGLTAAIRPPGLYASALVCAYFITQAGKQAIARIVLLLAVVGLVIFVSWPTLWVAPPTWFFEAVRGNLSFGGTHLEYFRGQILQHTDLPREYLVSLLGLQLTLVALLLAAIGLFASLHSIRSDKSYRWGVIILLLWLIVPIGIQAILPAPIYNNFRQLLFIVPPMFVLSAIGFQWLASNFGSRARWFVPSLALMLILPGLIGIFRLHPYEYTFYNGLAGGLSSARENYQLDYWCTSYRELVKKLNETATEGALVAVWGPVPNAEPFARDDLTLVGPRDEVFYRYESADFDYALACHIGLRGEDFFPEMQDITQVEREGAIMGVLKASISREGN